MSDGKGFVPTVLCGPPLYVSNLDPQPAEAENEQRDVRPSARRGCGPTADAGIDRVSPYTPYITTELCGCFP